MQLPIDLAYAGLALLAFLLGLIFVPLADLIGKRFGFVDAVNPAKIHTEPKVRCGGLGIYLAFMIALGLGLATANFAPLQDLVPLPILDYLPNIGSLSRRLSAVLLGASVLFLVGFVDDRFTLSPLVKLGFQILSAAPLIWAGVTIELFLPGPVFSAVATILWVVLISNAFNLLDNMNGLSSGVACMCALNFYLISRAGGEFFMMAMFALLLGSILGFLRYNFPRARLFMGDSGSLFIGYMLASLSILVTYYDAGVPTAVPVVAPLIVLGVPLFDTLSVMIIRWKNSKPLMQGDQNHFSHRLVALGFSRTSAVLFIWLVTFTAGLSAVYLRWLPMAGALTALAQVMLIFVIIHVLENVGRAKASN